MEYNERERIDLHIHTNASDGSMTPTESLAMAKSLGLKAIAITDHDTIDGCIEVLESGLPSELEFLTGVEISAQFPDSFKSKAGFHMLGYDIKPDNEELKKVLSLLKNAREDRNSSIIERLNGLGVEINIKDVATEAEKGLIGRPHFAKVFLRKGYVASMDEAFKRYIGTEGIAYVPKYRMPWDKAINAIRSAGGIPVLAHPLFLRMDNRKLRDFVGMLKSAGLEGIEIYYPDHKPENYSFYLNLAKEFNLKVTGGTDFHGANKPEINMGSGKGNGFFIPYSLYLALIAKTEF